MEGSREICWLVDSAADVQVCKDRHLMTDFQDRPTKVGGSTSDGISPSQGKVKLRLLLQDGSEGLNLNLNNIYCLPNSPCNLVSLGRLNNSRIYHKNKDKTLYDVKTRRFLEQAQLLWNSYFLRPLTLSNATAYLIHIDGDTYAWPSEVLDRI